MKQLVSVVTETSVLYLTHDSDSDSAEATQIAQVINPGLGIADVVRLGVTLGQALQLNGHRRAVTKTAPRELPAGPPDGRDKTGTKEADLVQCPVCKRGYRRSSLGAHLINVHDWARADAMRTQRARKALPPDTVIERGLRGGYRGYPVKRENPRRSPEQMWPELTRVTILSYLRAHPDATSRAIAEAITGTTQNRAVKKASNLLADMRRGGDVAGRLERGSRGSVLHWTVAT